MCRLSWGPSVTNWFSVIKKGWRATRQPTKSSHQFLHFWTKWSELVADSGTRPQQNLHTWYRSEICMSLFEVLCSFLVSCTYEGELDIPEAVQRKNLSLRILGYFCSRKYRCKWKAGEWFFYTDKNITTRSFSKFITHAFDFVLWPCFDIPKCLVI